jgi:hypothetical protein
MFAAVLSAGCRTAPARVATDAIAHRKVALLYESRGPVDARLLRDATTRLEDRGFQVAAIRNPHGERGSLDRNFVADDSAAAYARALGVQGALVLSIYDPEWSRVGGVRTDSAGRLGQSVVFEQRVTVSLRFVDAARAMTAWRTTQSGVTDVSALPGRNGAEPRIPSTRAFWPADATSATAMAVNLAIGRTPRQ